MQAARPARPGSTRRARGRADARRALREQALRSMLRPTRARVRSVRTNSTPSPTTVHVLRVAWTSSVCWGYMCSARRSGNTHTLCCLCVTTAPIVCVESAISCRWSTARVYSARRTTTAGAATTSVHRVLCTRMPRPGPRNYRVVYVKEDTLHLPFRHPTRAHQNAGCAEPTHTLGRRRSTLQPSACFAPIRGCPPRMFPGRLPCSNVVFAKRTRQ